MSEQKEGTAAPSSAAQQIFDALANAYRIDPNGDLLVNNKNPQAVAALVIVQGREIEQLRAQLTVAKAQLQYLSDQLQQVAATPQT